MTCNQDNVEEKLCSIMLSYRKTIHPATGKSPSMMVFGRQIRSRLDLMLPSALNIEKREIVGKVRSLIVNENVSVRDYLTYGKKWQFGKIQEKLGKLHYLIKLNDGRIWKRHIDQIRVIGPDCKDNVAANAVSVSREIKINPLISAQESIQTKTITPLPIPNQTTNQLPKENIEPSFVIRKSARLLQQQEKN